MFTLITPFPRLLSASSLSLRLFLDFNNKNFHNKKQQQPLPGTRRKRGDGVEVCKAELAQDAPFAAAIGACILNSLVFPAPDVSDDEAESGGAVDATDARFVVMGVISIIPYFNWLGKNNDQTGLPPSQDDSRNKLQDWGILRKPSEKVNDEDGNTHGERKQ
ncbi:hypothetical protein QJS10_CPB15g00870 [Acorus calamus]|uniref:Uncharacterized protein n=1 Tax=Acorus calamus TaxID=4465 RepID=A0AAV9D8W2_ACOCL|nr:hypothetical protein QJS10_CPB15g00870 [Acorus calamus]